MNNTGSPITVNYSGFGTAANGMDYTTLTGSVVIAAGAQTATIDVTPVNDALLESAETVVVTLTGTSNPSVTAGAPWRR